MRNPIILGSQWGDEGKGKLVDLVYERFDIVARYQGGNHAGHTVFIGEKKFVLKLIPSGILRPGKKAVIGTGLVIDPAALMAEIDSLESSGIDVLGNLFVSNRAHVLFPAHRMMEKMSEGRPGRISIGTTARGIGPCYEDKIGRRGIRIADLLDRGAFHAHYDSVMEEKADIAKLFGIYQELDFRGIRDEYDAFADRIRPMVRDTALLLNQAINEGKSVMFEGAQGSMLDIDHGTYPFVTSSHATAGGACTGSGVGPSRIDFVVGLVKAYCTRVGGGPFPTELSDSIGEGLRARGDEYGSVTGRPRRTGWLDLPALRYAVRVNGLDGLALTKLDVLTGLSEIKICTAYKTPSGTTSEFPIDDAEHAVPVYESVPGWQADLARALRVRACPEAPRRYVDRIERDSGCPVVLVSVGS